MIPSPLWLGLSGGLALTPELRPVSGVPCSSSDNLICSFSTSFDRSLRQALTPPPPPRRAGFCMTQTLRWLLGFGKLTSKSINVRELSTAVAAPMLTDFSGVRFFTAILRSDYKSSSIALVVPSMCLPVDHVTKDHL